VFAYEGAPLRELLDCWVHGPEATIAVVPDSSMLAVAQEYFGEAALAPSGVMRRGALELRAVPFMPQARYDELLWSCDVNFVRGEDSFVRAQWAARPLVWQIYPQAGEAHVAKLEAFLRVYLEGLPADVGDAVSNMMRAWNQIAAPGVTSGSAWQAFAAARGVLREHSVTWAQRLTRLGDLAANLQCFWRRKVKHG
jgi:uncharacterized repeat protein (TIGR03837 family)